MQLKFTKLYLTQNPIAQTQFKKLVPPEHLTQLQINNKSELFQFSKPIVAILLGYKIGHQFYGFQLEIYLELMVKNQKISYKLLEYKKTQNYLYKLIEVDSTIWYEKPIAAILTIKYTQTQHMQPIKSVQQLTQKLGRRQFMIYSEKTLSTIRRQLLIKQPISIQHKYSKKGYIWIKLSNTKNDKVKIYKAQLLNWLVKNNQQVKIFESKCMGIYQNEQQHRSQGVSLNKEDQLTLLLTLNKDLSNIQVPFLIQFSVGQYQGKFKLIRNLFLE